MARLTYRGVELQSQSLGRWLDLVSGYWNGVQVRGKDVVIPKSSGLYPGNRVAESRIVPLHGYVFADTEADHRAIADALAAIFDPTLDAGDLVATSPVLGLASGSKTISVRTMPEVMVRFINPITSEWDVQLLCITSPPDWT